MYDMSKQNSALEPLNRAQERNQYPEGLRLVLTGETLRKLAINPSDLQVGQVVDLCGQAEVVGIEAQARQIAGRETTVTLQLVALSVGDDAEPELEDDAQAVPVRDMAARLFE